MQLLTLNLLKFESLSIFEQLKMEEALLRSGEGNWCILNGGSPLSAIVMGISGKAEEHITPDAKITQIRRFSGGGTVVVDHNTCFFTLILDHSLFTCSCPKKFLSWVGDLIHFEVRENDFVIGNKKVGGNAQHFTNKRRLHHTSFLWDYDHDKMALLKMPQKVPEYRNGRSHNEFCTTLKNHFESKEILLEQIEKALSMHFQLEMKSEQDVRVFLETPHRQSLQLIKK